MQHAYRSLNAVPYAPGIKGMYPSLQFVPIQWKSRYCFLSRNLDLSDALYGATNFSEYSHLSLEFLWNGLMTYIK